MNLRMQFVTQILMLIPMALIVSLVVVGITISKTSHALHFFDRPLSSHSAARMILHPMAGLGARLHWLHR